MPVAILLLNYLPRLDPCSVRRVDELNVYHVDVLHGHVCALPAQAPHTSQETTKPGHHAILRLFLECMLNKQKMQMEEASLP